jgi:hypothetical protein
MDFRKDRKARQDWELRNAGLPNPVPPPQTSALLLPKDLSGTGMDKNEIQLLIFISQSRDYIIPSTSVLSRTGWAAHSCVPMISVWVFRDGVRIFAMPAMMLQQDQKGLLLWEIFRPYGLLSR